MQCEEGVKSPRRLHSQQEDRVCGLRRKSAVSDVTSVVRMEKVCSTRRRVASKV